MSRRKTRIEVKAWEKLEKDSPNPSEPSFRLIITEGCSVFVVYLTAEGAVGLRDMLATCITSVVPEAK